MNESIGNHQIPKFSESSMNESRSGNHQIPKFSESSMNESIGNHQIMDESSGNHQTPKFSEEERNGERLDLHEFHEKYVRYGFGCRREYMYYVHYFRGIFNEDVIPSQFKATPEYKDYLQSILGYLISYLDRAGMKNDNVDEVDWVGRDPFMKILREELEGDEWPGLDSYLEGIEEGFEVYWPTWPESNTQIDKDTGLLQVKVAMLCGLLRRTIFETKHHLFQRRSMNLIVDA